jgi:hypothetical protein
MRWTEAWLDTFSVLLTFIEMILFCALEIGNLQLQCL